MSHAMRTLAAALILLLAVGCGNRMNQQPPRKAEIVLDEFLDAWNRGIAPEKFAEANPGVRVTDPEWNAGTRLLSFLNLGAKEAPTGAETFRCRVALSLQDRQGKKSDREVVYEVRVGETTTIGRVAR